MIRIVFTCVLLVYLIGMSGFSWGKTQDISELSIEELEQGVEQRIDNKLEYLIELSNRYVKTRSVSKGLAITLQVLNDAKVSSDTDLLATLYSNAGFFYSLSHAYEDAVKNFSQSLSYARQSNDLYQMSIAYTGLGLVELKAKNFSSSIEYISQSLEIAERIDNNDRIVASKNNLASAKLRQFEFDLGWRAHQIDSFVLTSEQQATLEALSKDYSEFFVSMPYGAMLYNHGLVNNHLGNAAIAQASLLQAVDFFKQGNSDEGLVHSYIELARSVYLQKDFARALFYIEQANLVELSGQHTRLRLQRLKFQPAIFLVNDRTDLAQEAFSKYQFLSELNTNETAKLRVDATVRLDDMRFQEQQISQLSLEKKLDQAALSKERFLRNAQWSGIVVLFILLGLLYWLWRTRVKSYEIMGTYNKVLESQALQDGLTGILNRRAFEEYLEREHQRYASSNALFSLAMIDIDHFKLVNDTYGHTVGDEVLKKFASMVKGVCRKDDVACRWGGEEFMMMFRNTDKAQAKVIVERLLSDFSELTWTHSSADDSITFSAGVVDSSVEQDLNVLLTMVDSALYQGKDNGRACVISV